MSTIRSSTALCAAAVAAALLTTVPGPFSTATAEAVLLAGPPLNDDKPPVDSPWEP